jgi:ribonuclease J
MGVLNRLATGRHPSLSIQEDDTVVLSSHTIPGNEEMVNGVINRLFQKGADVYYDPVVQVHVSGHASQEEQKLLISMLRPEFFVPIHGELRHLKQHGKLACELGIPEENVAVVENGYPLTLADGQLHIDKRVPGGYVFVDGSLVGDTGPAVLRERDALGQSGFVTAIVRYDRETGKPVGRPRIVTQGFVFVPEAEELLSRAEQVVSSAARAQPGTPPEEIEARIERALSDYLYKETRRKPLVCSAVMPNEGSDTV